MFHTNGEFCNSFTSEHLRGPMDVAVNNLLILDHTSSCICTFTLDGEYVGKFDTQESGRGKLIHPYSLIANFNGFILVADTGNNRVLIFDEDGTCLHCFGCHGSAGGQFSTPRGIALSPNGSVYVTDAINKRVQIFSDY